MKNPPQMSSCGHHLCVKQWKSNLRSRRISSCRATIIHIVNNEELAAVHVKSMIHVSCVLFIVHKKNNQLVCSNSTNKVFPFFFPFSVFLHPASVILAGQRFPSSGGWVSLFGVRQGQWLYQPFECARHTHSGGLWYYESRIRHGWIHRCLHVCRQRAVSSALRRISQKPLLQRRSLCGYSAWLQVSWKSNRAWRTEFW